MNTVVALDLITSAFENLNVWQPGASIPAVDSQGALNRLNRMLGQWALQSFTIPNVTRDVFTLTAGKGGPSNPYSIGPGGDLNTDKPPSSAHITGVGLILGGVSPSVEIARALYTDDGYNAIPIKELPNALFTGLYYNATYTTGFGQVLLWPVPNTNLNSLVLYHESPLVSFADLSATSYTLPIGYDEALIYNLERRLAGPYGRAMPADDLLMANAGLRLIKRNNVGMSDMPNDFARSRRAGWFNIQTGQAGGG